MIRKIIFAILLVAVFSLASSVMAMTEQERQALIAQIQAQLVQLQAQLAQMLAQQQGPQTWCHTFNTNLGYANSGSSEINYLHLALQANGISYAPDTGNTYSDGTASGVVTFQQIYAADILTPYGLTAGTGFVGSATRAKLNQLYKCATNTNTNTNTNTSCTPIWYVGAWGACTNGQQTRTVTDSNSCGVTTNKPSTTQTCTSNASCTPYWQCGTWSTCSGGQQTRACSDSNSCGVTTNRPLLTQSCTATCTPNWSCTNWSTCSSSRQTRTCTDFNNCGITTNKPAATQSCYVEQTPFIKITSPNSPNGAISETWYTGDTKTIRWNYYGSMNIRMYVECYNPSDCSSVYEIPYQNITGSSYSWTINKSDLPKIPSIDEKYFFPAGYRIRVTGYSSTGSIVAQDIAYLRIDLKCKDADGQDYYNKGTITYMGTNYEDVCTYNNVKEYYCNSAGEKAETIFECPSISGSPLGCEYGACKKEIKFTGIRELVNGVPQGEIIKDMPQELLTIPYLLKGKSYQIDWSYTGSGSNPAVKITFNGINNSKYKFNVAGAVNNNTPFVLSDNLLTIPGGIYSLNIAYSEPDMPDYVSDYNPALSQYSSWPEVKVVDKPGTGITCTDSDGGKNYNVAGTASSSQMLYNWGYPSIQDQCIAGTISLREAYCATSTIFDYETYNCPFGCDAGKCQALARLTSPNGGETFTWNSPIQWTLNGAINNTEQIRIVLYSSCNNPPSFLPYEYTLATVSAGSLQYNNVVLPVSWAPLQGQCDNTFKIRLYRVSDNSFIDDSDGFFRISTRL